MKNEENFGAIVFFAVAIIFTVVFLPVVSFSDGFFPDLIEVVYPTDILKVIDGQNIADIVSEEPVKIILGIFIPAIVLLITSLAKSKVGVIISSAAGAGFSTLNILSLAKTMIGYDFEFLLDFKDTPIAYGFWLAVIGFVVCIILGAQANKEIYTGTYVSENEKRKYDAKTLQQGGWICSNCGKVNESYCGTCSCGNSKY